MTELDLQREIKNVLETEIIPYISIFEPGELKVFLQDIPLSVDYEDEDDKYFPCCIVKFTSGEIKNPSEPQYTTIEIIAAVKDWSEDMTGYQSLLIILQRIRDHFMNNIGICGKFRLCYPLKLNINDETSMPYFLGNIVSVWETDYMQYRDPLGFL